METDSDDSESSRNDKNHNETDEDTAGSEGNGDKKDRNEQDDTEDDDTVENDTELEDEDVYDLDNDNNKKPRKHSSMNETKKRRSQAKHGLAKSQSDNTYQHDTTIKSVRMDSSRSNNKSQDSLPSAQNETDNAQVEVSFKFF